MEEKVKLPTPLLIGGLVAIIAIAAFFVFRSFVPAGGQTYPDNPEVAWVKKKAKEMGGDWNKLTPEEQARANQATAGRGAMSVAMYGGQKH